MKTIMQEIFNKVVTKVLKQGKPSVLDAGCACLYRSPDGSKCAAGHLLPDKEYNESLEYTSVFDINWFTLNFDHDQLVMISDLQTAHDEASDFYDKDNPNNWKTEQIDYFRRVAIKHQLDQSLLEQF